MSSQIPYITDRAYELGGEFKDKQVLSAWPLPLSSGEQDLLITKLGAKGWVRVLHFTEFYGPGWGEGRNKQLSPKGQAAFLLYLQHAIFPAGAEPSVFLTDNGELELVWEDARQHSIQLTFGSQGIDLFHDRGEAAEERRVTHREAPVLAQQLSGM